MGYSISRKLAVVVATTVFAAVVRHGKSTSTEVWVSSVLDEAGMEDSGAQVERHPTHSAILCLAISQALEWGQASCFSEDRPGAQCRTWGQDALKKVAAQWNGTVGATTCKIRQSFVLSGCFLNETTYVDKNDTFRGENGEAFVCAENGIQLIGCFLRNGSEVDFNTVVRGPCGESFKCTEDGTIIQEKSESCNPTFKCTIAGCIHVEATTNTLEGAKYQCESAYNGNLFTAATAEEFELLRKYFLDGGTDADNVWVAVKKIDEKWQWLGSGRHPGEKGQGDWGPDDPSNGASDQCARANKGFNYKLGDTSCTNNYIFVCHETFN